jgi:DNA-binding XRE family transcriptional regulator
VQNVSDIAFLKALGNRVREIRISQNLTQEDLGFKVGNSGKQIGRIERGENNVTHGNNKNLDRKNLCCQNPQVTYPH